MTAEPRQHRTNRFGNPAILTDIEEAVVWEEIVAFSENVVDTSSIQSVELDAEGK